MDEMEAEEGLEEAGLVKLNTVAAMLLDWTDPRRIFGFAEATARQGEAGGAGELHYILAENVLERLVTSQVGREERKVLFGVLGKVHLPPGGCGTERLKVLLELLVEAEETKVAVDATGRNVLGKLRTGLLKFIAEAMAEERGGGGGEETTVFGEGAEGEDVVETTEVPVRRSKKIEKGKQKIVEEGENETEVMRGGAPRDDTEAEDPTAVRDEEEEKEEDDIDASVSQLQREMKDTTLGAASFGVPPDDEGTRVGLGAEREREDDESLVDRLIDSSVLDADGDTEMG